MQWTTKNNQDDCYWIGFHQNKLTPKWQKMHFLLCWAIFGDFGDLWPNQL